MGRVARALSLLVALAATSAAWAGAAYAQSAPITIFADTDDDDADGVADGRAAEVGAAAARDLYVLAAEGARSRPVSVAGAAVRLLQSGKPLAPGALVSGPVALQGQEAGTARVRLGERNLTVNVLEAAALDSAGQRIDLARSHASLSRTLPSSLIARDEPQAPDTDALSWYVAGTGDIPRELRVVSTRPSGEVIDTLEQVPTVPARCPSGVPSESECRRTPPIRATADLIDRSHPGSSGQSLRAEVGGKLIVYALGRKAAAIRVGGPRTSRLGPLERYRGRLRVRLVRIAPGGAVPIGGTVEGALALAREEVGAASALWGQCGIHFGLQNGLDVQVVDPPPPHLLAIGCDYGMPASGGEVAFRALGRELHVATRAGQTPTEVGNAVVAALKRADIRAELSVNPRIAAGALRSADVLVRAANGALAALETLPNRPLSSDPSLGVCLGEVDLADGLTHFTDFDAVAGTVEERALLKAFDDGDPRTIEVFIIPNFAKSGRIGESFIYADGASVQNAVILDRAGIRAGPRSYALAHELGHILLDMPDHPDDFGVDQPESLMDADAADPTIFGPRRLSVAECERALLQSGPSSPAPLLDDWPLYGAAAR